MKKEFENLIIDWNNNIQKLFKGVFFGSNNTPIKLMEFCLSVHEEVDTKELLNSLNCQREKFNKVLKLDLFERTLEHIIHVNILEKNDKENRIFKYEGEQESTLDLVLNRELDFSTEKISIKKITQDLINEEIVKQYEAKQFNSNDCFKFIFYQCKINDYKLEIIKDWVVLYKEKYKTDLKFNVLSKLPKFFDSFFTIDNDFEKLNLWINEYFENIGFIEFQNYFEFNVKDNSKEIINIFKDLHFTKLLKRHNDKLKESINSIELNKKTIIKLDNEIKIKPKFHFNRGQKPTLYESYNALVNGDINFFDDVIKKDRAGEVLAINDFIEYLKNQNIKSQKQNTVNGVVDFDSEDLLPIEIFENTRGYLKKNVTQVNVCYKHKAYDACSILLRKITEILIIELYEKEDLEHKIKDSDGHYYTLKGLINSFINEKNFNRILSRNMNDILRKIKRNGDLSAHNRKYNSTKHDIDKISDDFRILFQELINTIYH